MNEFETLCKGLTYITETDSDLTPFEAGKGDFEQFMKTQIAMNSNWRLLRDYMRKNLVNLQVIKFGQIQTTVWVFGEKDGKIIGFKADGVET